MKKKILLGICVVLLFALCACTDKPGREETESWTQGAVQTEDKFTRTEEMETIEEFGAEENEEEEIVEGPITEESITKDPVTEESITQGPTTEESAETNPTVFENIITELSGYPVLNYTLMGATQTIEYAQYNGPMYEMLSGPEGAISYTLGDVTGDGLEELMVSLYIVGNNLSDMWQDTYIYEIDADTNTLTEILFISADGCEQYAPGFPNNFGAVVNSDGTLLLTVATNDYGYDKPSSSKTIVLAYEDGMWKTKE